MRMTEDNKSRARAAIVAAAGILFRENGLAATGVDAIAGRVKQTSGAFYAHFASKAEVFSGAIAEGFVRLLAGIARTPRAGDVRWAARFAAGYLSRALRCAVRRRRLVPAVALRRARNAKRARSLLAAQLAIS